MPLYKNSESRAGGALYVHRATPKIGSGLRKDTASFWKEASRVQNLQWRDVYKTAPLADMSKEVTQPVTNGRLDHGTEIPQAKGKLQWRQRAIRQLSRVFHGRSR